MTPLLASLLFIAPSAFALETPSRHVVNNPTPALGRPWKPVLSNATTVTRHETVAEWHVGIALGRSVAAEIKWLGANITVPSFSNDLRYLSNELEMEFKAALIKESPQNPVSLSASFFANRYWLDTRDGTGARLILRRNFYGPKLIAEIRESRIRPSLILNYLSQKPRR